VVWAVGLVRPYIEGTKFLIRCDHKALKWILTTTACTNNRLNRWRILLSEFDYDVEYKPGRQHAVADALSRLPTEGLDTGPISQEIPTVRVTTRSGAVLDPRLPEDRETARVPLRDLAQKQADDEFCQEVKQLLDTSELTRFYQNADGLLCREGHRAGSQQLLIFRSLVKDVLRTEHSSPLAASRWFPDVRDHDEPLPLALIGRRRLRLGRGVPYLCEEPPHGYAEYCTHAIVPRYGTFRGPDH